MPRYLTTIRLHRQHPQHPSRSEYTKEYYISFRAEDETKAREKAREIARARAALKTANEKMELTRFGDPATLQPWSGDYEGLWTEV